MKRTNISLTEEQYEFLYEESYRQRKSVSELIRSYIPLKAGSFKKSVDYTINTPEKKPPMPGIPITEKMIKDATKQANEDQRKMFYPQPKVSKPKKK